MPAPRPHPDEIVVEVPATVRRRREIRMLVLFVLAALPVAAVVWLIITPGVALLYVVAQTLCIEVSVRQRTLLTGEHLEIIGDFLHHHEVEPLSRTLFSNINAYLRDPNTYILEAEQDGVLKGFATLSLTLQELPLLTLAFYRKGAQYVSDGVMYAAREYCIQQGYQRLGIGISGGESSYRYKLKWGAAPSSEPFASVFYLRKDSDFPVDVIGWGSRIIQHGRM